ncbi:unnamed protein product [Tuber aestivum]|uniref:F-box domain-containing protein n=1 Tax=Tuber aestivum TaxID=59557 RepID=A0A292Q396_9PEZI|nr:unnamed protein product [Tuber aestivum]
MPFVDLPNEIILQIAEEQEPPDINALLRTNRRFASCLIPSLWASVFRSPPQLYAVEALLSAAENGYKDVVRQLLGKGVLQYSQTPHWKIMRKVITERDTKALGTLMECGMSIDTTDPDDWTLLGLAAERGCLETLLLLVAHGFDVNEPGNFRCESPLSLAAKNKHDEVVQVLLSLPDINVNSKTELAFNTPLHNAAKEGDEIIVEILLADERIDVNPVNSSCCTPLHIAAEEGHEGVVDLLLAHKDIRPDIPGYIGKAPIHSAVCGGYSLIVRRLLSDRSVNSLDDCQRTPLYWASMLGCESVVRLLLQHNGVKVNLAERTGKGPMHIAACTGMESIVWILLQDERVEVDNMDDYGRTPLWWAAMEGHEGTVRLLLSDGRVDVNQRNNHGETILHIMAGHWGNEAIVQLLLSHEKTIPDLRDNDGRTPLYWAVMKEHDSVVRLLPGDPTSPSLL